VAGESKVVGGADEWGQGRATGLAEQPLAGAGLSGARRWPPPAGGGRRHQQLITQLVKVGDTW
jgi:hypothetical protein